MINVRLIVICFGNLFGAHTINIQEGKNTSYLNAVQSAQIGKNATASKTDDDEIMKSRVLSEMGRKTGSVLPFAIAYYVMVLKCILGC